MQRLLARARANGTADVIGHRLRVFTETTSPLIDYYRNRGFWWRWTVTSLPSPLPLTSRPACPSVDPDRPGESSRPGRADGMRGAGV